MFVRSWFGALAARRFSSAAIIAALGATAPDLPAQATADPLRSARAEEVVIAHRMLVDTSCFQCRPAFSKDETRLAYVVNPPYASGLPAVLKVIDLPSGELVRTVTLQNSIRQVAWSPDGERLLAIPMYSTDMAVIELGAGRVVPIGPLANTMSASDEVYWTEPTGVYFIAGSYGSERFDLESLSPRSLGSLDSAGFEALLTRLRSSPLAHAQIALRYDSRSQNFWVENRDGSFGHVFYNIRGGADHVFSPSARYVAVVDGAPRRPGEGLRLLVMGAGPAIPTVVEGVLTPLPASASPNDLQAIGQRLARRRPIYATVYAARRNPLNDRIVGAMGSAKARFLLTGIAGNQFTGRIVWLNENAQVEVGDALTDFTGPEPAGTADIRFRSIGVLVSSLSTSTLPPGVGMAPAEDSTSNVAASDTASAPRMPVAASLDFVLEAFDQYMRGSHDGVAATMSRRGHEWAVEQCPRRGADAAFSCMVQIYREVRPADIKEGRTVFRERVAEVVADDETVASVRLRTTWGLIRKRTLCQTFDLEHTPRGWRIWRFGSLTPCPT